MKKLFLLPLLLAATAIFAEDAVIVEKFSNVTQTSVTKAWIDWDGSLCKWKVNYARRGTNDLINNKQATWITLTDTTRGFIRTMNLEGGIKAVAFDAAQFGKEDANTLIWQISAGAITDTIKRDGTSGENKNAPRAYSHTFECKQNAQLEILNMSVVTATGLQPASNARLLIGDIKITPYLLYTVKDTTFQITGDSNKFKNTDLIDNTDEGKVEYSISENTIGATIDNETGEVTATDAGEVTITASWEDITTSYKLTILTKTAATAEFEEESFLVRINESAPVNEFTTNSTAKVEYSSSNEAVATVDETGAVTLVGVGTTTITANVPENDDFMAAEASYTIRVVPINWQTETFESATETASNYANPAESTTSDICKWTTQLGGVKHMVDATYEAMFGDTKYALFRAPRQNEDKVSYIESDSIEGGIGEMSFQVNPTAGEASTTWDVRVFINGVQVGENYSSIPTSPQVAWTTISVPNIKVDGKFVIRFENHSTISGTYTSGNKGRLAIDNIEWIGYEAPKYAVTIAEAENGSIALKKGEDAVASGDEFKAGIVLTIVPNPAEGYQAKTITVNDTPIEAVEDVYSFAMPAEAAEVAATFEIKTIAAFAEEEIEIELNEEAPANVLSKTEGYDGEVVYSSNAEDVAKVDAESGEVTIVGIGEAVITATLPQTDTYGATEASYVLTVNRITTTASFASDSLGIKWSDEIPENKLTTNSSGTIVYESLNEEVVTVDSGTGALTKIGLGTAVIKATVLENATYTLAEATYKFTIEADSTPEDPTALDLTNDEVTTSKVISNGQLLIIREGVTYTPMGQVVK